MQDLHQSRTSPESAGASAKTAIRVVLRSPEGDLLALGLGTFPAEPGQCALERVLQGKGALLGYYFGRGGRAVVAEFGAFRLEGWLETSWAGSERHWTVLLRSPLEGQ